jgi:glutamyl-tRNA synthetase
LYNYLFAKKHNGTFILRIEDTDQVRYVPGAEEYIIESLKWCGIMPDEGPGIGGIYAPYRQSERRTIYQTCANDLIKTGKAYYAFDTPEELESRRTLETAKGNHNWKYDSETRLTMKNSLTLPDAEIQKLLDNHSEYVIRLLVAENETVTFFDLIRGEVSFQTNELDDKVLLKADGMPTYHLANIVDDYLMKVTHAIRGEEWLPSTGHHVLLYRAFGWESQMPQFAHLPLILKPDGKGKLSKRDGAKFGMPVFPLEWTGEFAEDSFPGFREFGFLPEAVLNFLAFLGWNPGTEQEIFSLEQLCEAFSIDKISKGGARFDYEKARWYNQQYLHQISDEKLADLFKPIVESHGHSPSNEYIQAVAAFLKERAVLLPDLWENGYFFFEAVKNFNEENILKRWDKDCRQVYDSLFQLLSDAEAFEAEPLETLVKDFIQQKGLKMGNVFPLLRIAMTGSLQGPAVFQMMQIMGKAMTLSKLHVGFDYFDGLLGK